MNTYLQAWSDLDLDDYDDEFVSPYPSASSECSEDTILSDSDSEPDPFPSNVPPWEDINSSYDSLMSNRGEKITSSIEEWVTHLHGPRVTLSTLVDRDRGRQIFYIQSVVGDDETTTSNSYLLGPVLVACGPPITGIKISKKDVGDSHYLLNYAEGWILTPLTSESTFEATNRRHQGSGIPFILDPVKQKFLSPVRKQSEKEMDLESKMVHLSETASWTDPDWFTYPYHQMALLLATVSFDFKGARSFPFLYKTEGGCGGPPPFNNVDTAHAMIHHYTRGKSTRAILGVMRETVEIHQGRMEPRESFFLKAAHLAQAGDKRWLEFTTAFKSLQQHEGLTRTELRERVREMDGTSLPQEIANMGTDVEPSNPVLGTAVSHLRQDGFLMTELDVKLIMDKFRKSEAVFGEQPIKQVLAEIDENQRAFKANMWKTLSLLVERDLDLSQTHGLLIPMDGNKLTSQALHILIGYYSLKARSLRNFTSLAYSDTLKIFKASDIKKYFEKGDQPLRHDFLKTEGIDKVKVKFPTDIKKEIERKERISAWIESSSSLVELLEGPIPVGVGPDDGRIFRQVMENLQKRTVQQPTVVILFSSDRDLVRLTSQYLRSFSLRKNFKAALIQIKREDYIKICLAQIQEFTTFKRVSRSNNIDPGQAVRAMERSKPGFLDRIPVYNYILKVNWPIPTDIHGMILRRMQSDYMGGSKISVLTEYDVPNLERGLESTEYNGNLNAVVTTSGGFIPRQYIRDQTGWSEMELGEIKNLPVMTANGQKRTTSYKPGELSEISLNLVNPMSHSDLITDWRTGIKTPESSIHARSASWRSGSSGT
jgi:hypothetical protein